jgi:DNA-binding NarL/FixJ family response regulator
MNASQRPQLDPLERLVLELAAEGLSTTEIAATMGAPVDRVRAHTSAVLAKLGARSKLEALIIAIRHGLIRLPPT